MRGASTEVTRPAGAWPTLVGLAILWIAAVADQVWLFAALFIGWALFDVLTGESHFVQRITRRDHPFVFWAIITSWIAMSILWVLVG
ncbi:MAG: hypothetical protein AAGA90_00640 [Actinomycetota bacterium]